MPNITQYTAENTKLNEAGFESTARRIGAFGSQEAAAVGGAASIITQGLPHAAGMLGQAVEQHIDYMDRGRVASAATAGLAKLQQDWETTKKGTPDPNNPGQFITPPIDPNDQQAMARFQRDRVEPFLQDLQSLPIGINGGRYAQAKADELRQHLSTQMQADMGHLAQDAAVLNYTRGMNNLAASAAANPDIHNMHFLLDQSKDIMANHKSGASVTAEGASHLTLLEQKQNTDLVHTGAAAAIMQSSNPEATAAAWTKEFPDYIKPAEEITLAKQARQQIKFNASMDRSAQIQQRELQKEAAKDVGNQLQASLIDPETGGHIPAGPEYFKGVQKFMQMKGADPAQARALFEFGEKHDGTDHTYTDPNVGRDVSVGIIDGTKNELDLMKAHNAGTLSDKDYSRGLEDIKIMRDFGTHDEAFKVAMHQMEEQLMVKLPGITGKDAVGPGLVSGAANELLRAYSDRVKKHETKPNDLNLSDPNSFISQIAKKYERTPAQKYQDYIKGIDFTGTATTGSPFETAMKAGTLERNTKTGELRDTVTGKRFKEDGTEIK